MSNHDDTDAPARPTVPQFAARLLLLQQREQLPDPIRLDVNDGRATVALSNRSEFNTWNGVLAAMGSTSGVHEIEAEPRRRLHVWAYIHDWDGTGCTVSLELNEPPSAPATSLDPETIEALTDLAAVPA